MDADLTLITSVSSSSGEKGYILSVSDYSVLNNGDLLKARIAQNRQIKVSKRDMKILDKAYKIISKTA